MTNIVADVLLYLLFLYGINKCCCCCCCCCCWTRQTPHDYVKCKNKSTVSPCLNMFVSKGSKIFSHVQWFYTRVAIIFTKLSWQLKKQMYLSDSNRIYRSKGNLGLNVNAHIQVMLIQPGSFQSLFPSLVNRFIRYKNPAMLLISLFFNPLLIF